MADVTGAFSPAVQQAGSSDRLPPDRAVAWGLIGSIGYAASQWGILWVLARSTTPELVGQFSYGLAVSAPVIMLTNMQTARLLATGARVDYPFGDYWRHRFLFGVIAIMLIAVLAFMRDEPALRLIVICLGVAKVIESYSDIHYGRFQRDHRQDLVAKSQLLRGGLGLIALAVVVESTQLAWTAVLAMAAVWFAVWVLYERRAATDREERGRASPARVWALTREALPLGLTSALISVNVAIPRLVIEWYAGIEALGVFAAMAYLVVAGRLVALPFAQVFSPRLGEALAAKDRPTFRRHLSTLGAVGLLLGAVGLVIAIVAGGPVLQFLYGAEYAGEGTAFIILMAAAAVGYLSIFLLVAATAARELGRQVPIVLASGAVSLVTAFALVPDHPVVGGAMSLLAGAAIEFLGVMWLLSRVLRREW